MILFFRFPCNLEIEVSPLIQITPVSTKKITVEGMGFFFQFPIKGEREGRERRKERAIEQQLTTSRSRKKHEIKEAAILNFQTTAVFDFQMGTRSPIFIHSLKIYLNLL